MKILALEFSSPQRSVAVVQGAGDGPSANGGRPGILDTLAAFSEVIETCERGGKPLGMVTEALREAGLEREQIECLAIGLGPGSYTGIRSAIALAQGWQLAAGQHRIKLLGISSAECLAAGAKAEGLQGSVYVVIDAQRNEFYLAAYDLEGLREIEPLRLATFAEVQERERARQVIIGPEVAKWFPRGRVIFPRAATLGQLALTRRDFVAGEKLEPIYLRETKFVKAPLPRAWPSGTAGK